MPYNCLQTLWLLHEWLLDLLPFSIHHLFFLTSAFFTFAGRWLDDNRLQVDSVVGIGYQMAKQGHAQAVKSRSFVCLSGQHRSCWASGNHNRSLPLGNRVESAMLNYVAPAHEIALNAKMITTVSVKWARCFAPGEAWILSRRLHSLSDESFKK